MYKLSKKTESKLFNARPEFSILVIDVLKFYDIGISYSYRGEEEQNRMFLNGASKLTYPNSAHNQKPSLAIDFILYVDGVYVRGESLNEQKMYEDVRVKFYESAKERGIKLMPLIVFKSGAKDLGHIELDLK